MSERRATEQACLLGNRGAAEWLLKHAPDFCWCTALDLYRMVELEFPDLCPNSFANLLSRLKRQGHFLHRPYEGLPYPNPPGYTSKTTSYGALLYLRVNRGAPGLENPES